MANEMNDIFFAIEALERATQIIRDNVAMNEHYFKGNAVTIERARKAYENIMPKTSQPRVVYSDEPLTSCGCNHPGAIPPCSYCCGF
jgi:hypothetical protein